MQKAVRLLFSQLSILLRYVKKEGNVSKKSGNNLDFFINQTGGVTYKLFTSAVHLFHQQNLKIITKIVYLLYLHIAMCKQSLRYKKEVQCNDGKKIQKYLFAGINLQNTDMWIMSVFSCRSYHMQCR